jgi:hypothetical protein
MLASEIAKGRKRRILTDFVIDKIAAVDNPCNEHARVAIIKRAELPDDDSEEERRMRVEREVEKMANDFPMLVQEVQKRDRCTRSEALTRAATENPGAVAAYRISSPVCVPEIAKREEAIAKGRERQRNIDKRTREIMARDSVNRTQALMTLHGEEPEVFKG